MGSYLKINGLYVADLNSFYVQQVMEKRKLTKTVGGEMSWDKFTRNKILIKIHYHEVEVKWQLDQLRFV